MWTKIKKLDQKHTIKNLQELHHCSQTKNKPPTIPLQSTFQPGPDTQDKQSTLLEHNQVPQELKINFPHCYETSLI